MDNYKNILSTALHDIYNEINNLFFLSESLLNECHCIDILIKENFQKDFFSIINQIKSKQFIFNNIHGDKPIDIESFKRYTFDLYKIIYIKNIELPIGLLCCLMIINYGEISFTDHIILPIKPKYNDGKFWAMNLLKVYLENWNYDIKNNILTIELPQEYTIKSIENEDFL
jgi:hypothetical protein